MYVEELAGVPVNGSSELVSFEVDDAFPEVELEVAFLSVPPLWITAFAMI